MQLLFQSWKRDHMSKTSLFSPALSDSLINDDASLFKPCFCFLGGPPQEQRMTEASSGWQASELGEGKTAMDQKPLPLTDGLCQTSQAGAWWQVCVSSALVSCSYTVPSATLAHLTTWQPEQQQKKEYFLAESVSYSNNFMAVPWGIAEKVVQKQVVPLLALLAQCHWKLLTNLKYLLPLSVWVTVSKWLRRQTLPNSRFMTYLNNYTGKICKWRSSFDGLFFLFPRMKNTAKCQLFLVKLAELQLLTV